MLLRGKPAGASIGLSVIFGFNLFPGQQEGIVWASWTLGVEMLFYLLLPVISLTVRTWQSAATSSLVAISGAYLWMRLVPASYNNFSFLHHLPVFMIGILCYRLYCLLVGKSNARLLGTSLVATAIVGHLALAYASVDSGSMGLYLHAIVYAALALGLGLSPSGILVNRCTCLLGKLSYSLYLNHPLLIATLAPVCLRLAGASYCGTAALTFSALLCISAFTYRFVEQPGVRFGSRTIRNGVSYTRPA